MHHGSCHCGAVSFDLRESPTKLVDCNCSICHRLGALWAHVPISSVQISSQPNSTNTYVQGDKTLAIHTCKTCGCSTHWESLLDDGEHMAVNFRMCDITELERFDIKKFDGAHTWQFLE